MQNRKAVILLLIVTGVVWGLIVYRIIKTVKGSDTKPIQVNYTPSAIPHAHDSDTFSLIADYRDPFLDYLEVPKPVYTAPVAVKAPPPPPKPNIPFPAVSYLGRVKNHDSQKKVAIMMISKSIRNMSEGDKYNDITLVKLMGDSVQVSFFGEKKIITKSARREIQKETKQKETKK